MKEEGVENGHGAAEWLDTRRSGITPIFTPWVSLDQLDSVGRDIRTAWLLMDSDNEAAARSYAKVEPAARSAPAVMLVWSL